MENLNPQHTELGADKILNKIDTNEEYQKAIDKNLAKEEQRKLDEAKKSTVPDMGITEEKVENTPLVIEKPKPKEELKKDLFGLNEQKTQPAPEPIVKKEVVAKTVTEPKKTVEELTKKIQTVNTVPKAPVKKESSIFTSPEKKVTKPAPEPVVKKTAPKTTAGKVSGYYIQVGAFTKQPSKKLLDEISAKGFNYVVHPMTIKGTKYNKVLIGGYPTRKAALDDLNNVKQKLKKSGAYILKI
jgi:DedD protein